MKQARFCSATRARLLPVCVSCRLLLGASEADLQAAKHRVDLLVEQLPGADIAFMVQEDPSIMFEELAPSKSALGSSCADALRRAGRIVQLCSHREAQLARVGCVCVCLCVCVRLACELVGSKLHTCCSWVDLLLYCARNPQAIPAMMMMLQQID